MSVFFEVAKTDDPKAPFAVIRIDTDKRVGTGVEGVVVSTHHAEEDAYYAKLDAVMIVNAAGELERLRAFASDVQWDVVMGALDKWTKHGGSDLLALGIIGHGLLILDDLRRAALADSATPPTA